MRATIAGNRKLAVGVTVCALLVLASIAVAGVAIWRAASGQQHTNRDICIAFNRFDAVITATLERSSTNLPKLAYFRAHPLELAQQEDEVHKQLEQFRQQPC